MNWNVILCIAITILIVNVKWIVIAILFPFQTANAKRRKVKYRTGKKVGYLYLLSAPYVLWERYVMNGGWQRYMLFQVGIIPSLHLRKWIYKCLGADVSHDVVFHFKTEVRAPEFLVVGGVL